jgi:hypothetical protein
MVGLLLLALLVHLLHQPGLALKVSPAPKVRRLHKESFLGEVG